MFQQVTFLGRCPSDGKCDEPATMCPHSEAGETPPYRLPERLPHRIAFAGHFIIMS